MPTATAPILDFVEQRYPGAGQAAAQGVNAACATLFQRLYRDDPVGFVRDCFRWKVGEGPTKYQRDSMQELLTHRRLALRGPHGLGKTAELAWIVLWFALTRDGQDWKAITTASAWRQLTHYLWPEIHKWARRLRWDRVGRAEFDERTELLQLNLKLNTGEAFAAASDRSETIEGAHADHLLYILDEAKTIPAATFDAVEGALLTGDCYAITVSTPGEPQGRFYEIHARRAGLEDWHTRHVTLAECIEAGRVPADRAEQRRKQWGENSAVYQNRVLGEFASSEEDGVIPLAWIEAANARWQALEESGEWGPLTRLGIDVARGGEDSNVIAYRHGRAIRRLRHPDGEPGFAKGDTMSLVGLVKAALTNGGEASIDLIGVGAGAYDRLREQGLPVRGFNASAHTDMRDRSGEFGFVNVRSAGWWNLREMLDPASGEDLALPPDDLLIGDLTAPHWRIASAGRIQVEAKDDIKKRLHRSTDDGDAVVMAMWEEMVVKAEFWGMLV